MWSIYRQKIKNTEKRLEWENGSRIDCHTGGSKNFGRSFGFRYLHISEAAYIPKQREVLTSLLNTVPDDPGTVVVIESTANGQGDEFHRGCMRALRGESEFTLFFFAWHGHPFYVKTVDNRLVPEFARIGRPAGDNPATCV